MKSGHKSKSRVLRRLLGQVALFAVAVPGVAVAQDDSDVATVTLGYIGDFWTVLDGAEDNGLVYLENADAAIELNLEQVMGWDGSTLFVRGLYNNSNSISQIAGDAQVISNIETGVNAIRLYEAWVEQRIGDRVSVKLGLYDLNSEFDVLDSAGLFINSAHGIGSVIGLSGENGPSIFPVTSLAARISFEPADGWAIRGAVLDGVPGDPDNPDSTVIELEDGDGALIVAEVEAPLPRGKVLLGYWRYTAQFETFDGLTGTGNDGWYVRAESQLYRDPANAGRVLTGFGRLGWGDGRYNAFHRFAGAGLTLSSPFVGRPEDEFGVAIAAAFPSDDFESVTENNSTEVNVELTYSAQVTDWLRIQPDIQWIFNPSADPAADDVVAAGLRFELGWEF
ncbi:carbohydrate porin [Parasphingopyxis algicola]|uniref:carbohydrate porin n=1 Tax=Parasphingopyxis algicola TaxID=2026624 RepID=UPI0015A403CC|nr:carbohydrate porin [Parasphingopyxis algicola]QLC23912.1 carbohydrate porin [Parasphingopyxis algicola]